MAMTPGLLESAAARRASAIESLASQHLGRYFDSNLSSQSAFTANLYLTAAALGAWLVALSPKAAWDNLPMGVTFASLLVMGAAVLAYGPGFAAKDGGLLAGPLGGALHVLPVLWTATLLAPCVLLVAWTTRLGIVSSGSEYAFVFLAIVHGAGAMFLYCQVVVLRPLSRRLLPSFTLLPCALFVVSVLEIGAGNRAGAGVPAEAVVTIVLLAAQFFFFSLGLLRTVLALQAGFLEDLEAEYEAAESSATSRGLLDAMLPAPVILDVQRSLDAGKPLLVAYSFDAVHILQSDIVDFTRLGERITPEQLCGMLHELFTIFDGIAGDLGVTKIETIGDAYVACTGGVSGEEDPAWVGANACQLARMAVAMQEACAGFLAPDGTPIRMRIGVHTAPAVGGIVGQLLLRYHLFGRLTESVTLLEAAAAHEGIRVSAAFVTALGPRARLASDVAADVASDVAADVAAGNGSVTLGHQSLNSLGHPLGHSLGYSLGNSLGNGLGNGLRIFPVPEPAALSNASLQAAALQGVPRPPPLSLPPSAGDDTSHRSAGDSPSPLPTPLTRGRRASHSSTLPVGGRPGVRVSASFGATEGRHSHRKVAVGSVLRQASFGMRPIAAGGSTDSSLGITDSSLGGVSRRTPPAEDGAGDAGTGTAASRSAGGTHAVPSPEQRSLAGGPPPPCLEFVLAPAGDLVLEPGEAACATYHLLPLAHAARAALA